MRKWLRKVKVLSTEEAFEWFCEQGNGPDVWLGCSHQLSALMGAVPVLLRMPGEEPILKAKSFEWVLKFLGVPGLAQTIVILNVLPGRPRVPCQHSCTEVNEADRMILWAEMDADNTGQVSRQEFEEPAGSFRF